MVKKLIHICHLYPKKMNIYGDTGNVKTLVWRLQKRGVAVKVSRVEIGDTLSNDIDILIAGGGQDSGQLKIQTDLARKKSQLQAFYRDGVVMLTICGMYQLFGREFITHTSKSIKGAAVLDLYTIASERRHIGNIVIRTEFGKLVGFENHSGLTYLGPDITALGQVIKGTGNNDSDKGEGANSLNTFGTYLHGPMLPKNPVFADELLHRALERKYGIVQLEHINDSLADAAHKAATRRPR